MRPWKIVAVAVVLVVLDQLTKYWVRTHMQVGESIPLAGNWLALTYIHNYGGAFGVFQNKQTLFLLTGWGVVAALLFSLPRIAALHWTSALSYALILGGALGNLWDRSLSTYVVDFVEVKLPGPWGPGFRWADSFPCWNVADSGITVGITVLLILSFFTGEKKEEASPVQASASSA